MASGPSKAEAKGSAPSRSRLAGRLCVVGGASGIVGSGICRQLLMEGARVVGLLRHEDQLKGLLKECQGGRAAGGPLRRQACAAPLRRPPLPPLLCGSWALTLPPPLPPPCCPRSPCGESAPSGGTGCEQGGPGAGRGAPPGGAGVPRPAERGCGPPSGHRALLRTSLSRPGPGPRARLPLCRWRAASPRWWPHRARSTTQSAASARGGREVRGPLRIGQLPDVAPDPPQNKAWLPAPGR